MDDVDYVPEPNFTLFKFMIAGSTAGVMEHLCMFPVDTIKTRMQTTPAIFPSVSSTVSSMLRREGIPSFYRGCAVIVAAAVPSHAVHFSTYETMKDRLGGNEPGHHPFVTGMSGAVATCAHDAVVTPLDVVKQRLQMANSPFVGFTDCIRHMGRQGALLRTLYSSYPITVIMNIPFVATHFAAYESFKKFFTNVFHKPSPSESPSSQLSSSHSPTVSVLSGALAGSCAGFISTPFDVVKTTIQTRQEVQMGRVKLSASLVTREILKSEGFRGFWKGASARVLYFLPSGAICFTAYEHAKHFLKTAW